MGGNDGRVKNKVTKNTYYTGCTQRADLHTIHVSWVHQIHINKTLQDYTIGGVDI